MTATKRRIALDIVATDTHCDQDCGAAAQFSDRCRWLRNYRAFDHAANAYKRLPECIAAEKAQGGAGEVPKQALLGVIQACGHACAIDADTSQEARDEMAAEGHDVLTLPFSDALQRFNREWDEHLKTCEKASEQP